MKIDNENLKYLETWINDFLERQDISEIHIKDKYEHSYRTAKIAKLLYPDNKLLEIAMKFHDIGRFVQFKKISSFDDNILSHYIVGREYVEELEKNEEIKSSKELDIIKYVIKYHMGSKYIKPEDINNIDKNTLELIELSSIVDAIDNGCIGATYYIEREIQNDEKHYIVNYPSLDMKSVSKEVLYFYLTNEKFDKFKYCKTYADYLLYAVILLIVSLKYENKDSVIKIIQKEKTIEKYNVLINKYINPSDAKLCIDHLNSVVNTYILFVK